MKKTFILAVSTIFVLIISLAIFWGYEPSLVCDITSIEAKHALCSWLKLNCNIDTTQKEGVQLNKKSVLFEIVGDGFYFVPEASNKSHHWAVVLKRDYFILAEGSETIYFSLIPLNNGSTKIKVEYSDIGLSLFPPYFFYNPGLLKEQQVLKALRVFFDERTFRDDKDY